MSKYLVLHTKDAVRTILKPKVMRSFYQQLSRGHVYIDFIKWQYQQKPQSSSQLLEWLDYLLRQQSISVLIVSRHATIQRNDSY